MPEIESQPILNMFTLSIKSGNKKNVDRSNSASVFCLLPDKMHYQNVQTYTIQTSQRWCVFEYMYIHTSLNGVIQEHVAKNIVLILTFAYFTDL